MKKERIKIIPGNTYGKISVLDVDSKSKKAVKIYICRCERCGRIFTQTGQDISNYQSGGCPACRKEDRNRAREKQAAEYIGVSFGNLEVMDVSGIKPMYNRTVVLMTCKCLKCGNITEIPLVRLKSGQAKECEGCMRKNLSAGVEVVKVAAVNGTSILGIDGRRTKNKNNSSGHNGVSMVKKTGRWRAYINFQRVQYHLGMYDTLDDAIRAREKAEKEIYGNFCEWYAETYPEQWEKLQKKGNSR